jgi:hypothetical protein
LQAAEQQRLQGQRELQAVGGRASYCWRKDKDQVVLEERIRKRMEGRKKGEEKNKRRKIVCLIYTYDDYLVLFHMKSRYNMRRTRKLFVQQVR